MTVRTSELLSPFSEVAITSMANGFSQGMIVRSTAKRPATSGAVRFPLTLTVASGEVIPTTVMVSESITMSSEGKVTSSVKGAGVAVGAKVGSAVGGGKGAWVGVGVGTGVGVKVGVWLGLGDGTGVAMGLGVSVGLGVVTVTGVGEASTVAVGARVADSWPHAMDRTRMKPKRRPRGATEKNGMITAIGFLATDWDGVLSLGYRDMHIPPNTSSNRSKYKGLCLDSIADESTSYVKIGRTMLEWYS